MTTKILDIKAIISPLQDNSFLYLLSDCIPDGLVRLEVIGQAKDLLIILNKPGHKSPIFLEFKTEKQYLDIQNNDFVGLEMAISGVSEKEIKVMLSFIVSEDE